MQRSRRRQRVENRVAEPAFDAVVLHDHEGAGVAHRATQGGRVDRLDAVAVEHAGGDPIGAQDVVCRETGVERDARADQRDVVVVGGGEGLGSADRERLVGRVQRGRRLPGRADVGDALEPRHRLDEGDGAHPVGRVQDGGAVERAEERQILDGHLRRSVFTDRHAGVRAAQPQVGPADRAHADLICRAREERAERRGERRLAERLQPGLDADHALLGDVQLEEALGRHGLGFLRVCRVPDLTVEHHDVVVGPGEPRERVPERLAGRDRSVIRGARRRAFAPQRGRVELRRPRRGAPDPTVAAELAERFVESIGGHRLAVPVLLVGQERHPVALLRAGHDERRPLVGQRVAIREVDLIHVVPVDLDGAPAERLGTVAEHVRVPPVHRLAALSEPVEVQDRRHVAGPVERRRLHRLPDRPLGHLGVAEHDPHVRVDAVDPHRQRHPETHGQPLAERARRHVDPGEVGQGHGMTLER